jgi:hypothetical protein
MPGDPKECREHAKHCLELASHAPPSSLTRARFEDLAQTWLRLARDLDHSKALLEQWGDARFRKSA